MIPQETIEQIRQATDIVDVIGEFVRLKKRGKNYTALCPFHTERTPSFSVSQDKQIFHCFGCGKGGNAFTFLMEHERMSFIEVVRHLAQKANITIREEGASGFKRDLIERISFANQIALQYFELTLRQNKYKMVLDDYLKQKRLLTEQTISDFNLGLAGDEWEGLINFAAKKDISTDELVKAGLAIHNEEKKSYYDRFHHRLMIPIFNLSCKPIAFGGRQLKKEDSAKYMNSPETPLYQKSNVLFGLSLTKDHIRNQNFAFIVEGYFDLISLWQAGIRNVVASSGTAFTLQQARLLARFAEQVYLFFDADSAGQKAALRSVDILYDTGLDVRIIQPPAGEDPDSVARKFGPDKIEELRSAAIGFIPFRLKEVNVNNAGIIGKEKLIKEFGAIGNKIADITRRTLFLNQAADALGVNVSIFQPTGTGKYDRRPGQKNLTVSPKEFNPIEMGLLSLLFHNPGAIDEIFENISPEDFDSKQMARLYSAIIDQYRHIGKADARSLIDNAGDAEFSALIAKVASQDWPAEQIETETLSHARHLTNKKKKLIRGRLKQKLAEAEAQGDREKADNILEELKSYGL
jgi:DNA primase